MGTPGRRWVVVAAVVATGCSFDAVSAPVRDSGVIAQADTASPDAPIDAALEWTVVETMMIDTANATPEVSTTVLEEGVEYRLRASGMAAAVIDGEPGDAEYWDFERGPAKSDGCCEDIGIGIDDPTVDLDTTPDWGPYNPQHVYETSMTGKGAVIAAAYQDTVYDNNSGVLTLEILALQ